MSEATTVRFLLDDKVHEVRDVEPTTTVLNYLRERINRTGTKEGCAEGDCGACTVVIAELRDDKIRARSVNACIQFLPTLDGKALFTVESLKSAMNNRLHPAQQAMVDCHGSQCGFCTPGFVMSLFGLYKNNPHPTRQQIDDALAGNLCRCTGYRPIIAAAHKMYEYSKHLQKDVTNWAAQPCGSDDKRGEQELMKQLRTIQRTTRLSVSAKFRYFAPTSADDLAKLALEHPDATILAGGTDVGLWVTKLHKDLLRIIYIGDVKALDAVNVSDTHIEIGAAVNLTDAYEKIIEYYPDLEEIYRRFGSPPIRNAGTLVGNIANGSPIGDSMPALICLGASIVLRKG
ncbi:MAG: FAD binding domain-containing protein, partial [Gammaproteobacteria bacterium]|nr:FAD binding domain-containing protein [Gammaproteobacteria bacterium]